MRRRAASAAAGAVTLISSFGLTHYGIRHRTPAGHRESASSLSAAFVPSTAPLGDDDWLAEVGRRHAETIEAARVEAERVEAESQAAEEAAEAARVAAEKIEKAARAAAAVKATSTTVRPVSVVTAPVAGGANNGTLKARIGGCESGSGPTSPVNYTAKNPRSTASGAYQYLDSTWNFYGGFQRAMDAPPWMQEERMDADLLNGTGPWRSSQDCWG